MFPKNSQKNKGFTLLNPIKREFRKKRNYLTGFTLIELLIVVAIIGMLSAVVAVSQKGSLIKGADAAVKTGLQQIIAQAENYYSNNDDNFGDQDCSGLLDDTNIARQKIEVQKRAYSNETLSCSVSGDGQGVAVSIKLKSGKYWCVDNDSYKNYGTAQDGTCSDNE